MGYTDSMPYHTGTTKNSRTTYGCGTQYRNIEGLWDNVYDWMDGCYYNGNGLNIIKNPSQFSDSANGVNVGTLTSGYPSKFTVRSQAGFPVFVPSQSNGSDSTYSCDHWNFDSSSPCLYVGGNYNQNTNHGLFYVNYNSTSNSNANIGCRILFVLCLILHFTAQVVAHPLVKISKFGERVSTPLRRRWKARTAKRRKYPCEASKESL